MYNNDHYHSGGMGSGSADSGSSTSDVSSNVSTIRLWVLAKLSDVFWFLILLAYKLIMPAFKVLALGIVIVMISISLSYLLFLSLSPKSLLKERVYFDFSLGSPSAKVSLLAKEKQWYYLKDEGNQKNAMQKDMNDNNVVSVFNNQRFLKSDARYSIDANVVLTKCPRNLEIGKFMLHTTVVDTSGDAFAKSSRPIAVPYESTYSIFLYSVLMFPFRFVGFSRSSEHFNVEVNIMNGFKEPSMTIPATEYFELMLSTNEVDIIEVYLSIMPVLQGLTYYVYYYPNIFLILCSVVLSVAQVVLVAILLLTSWFLKYVSSLFSRDSPIKEGVDPYVEEVDDDMDGDSEEEEEDEEEDDDKIDGAAIAHIKRGISQHEVLVTPELTSTSLNNMSYSRIAVDNLNTASESVINNPLGIAIVPPFGNLQMNDDNDNDRGGFIADETWSSSDNDELDMMGLFASSPHGVRRRK